MPSTFGFRHNCSGGDYFQATPTPVIFMQYVCRTNRYKPFLYKYALTIPFPQDTATDVLDNLHKLYE